MSVSAKLKHSPTLTNPPKLRSQKPIACSFCGCSFRHVSAFTVHKRLHTGEKLYRCSKCGKSFAQVSQMKMHSDVHNEPQAVHCPCCSQKCKNKDELIIHFQIHLKNIQRPNTTKDATEAKSENVDSLVVSIDAKPFRCSTCFKDFINKATFKMHQQTHRGVKPHTCSVCRKKFYKSSSLHAHEKTHWPVKPYACSVCGKAFVKLLELKSHSQMHLGAMLFFSFASLRKHQFTKVSSEKQDSSDTHQIIDGFPVAEGAEGQILTPTYYKCPICKQLHRYWCQYILHFQMHANSESYFCEICGQQYNQAPEKINHCKVCCRASGEERECGSTLSEVWQEPETAQNQILKTISSDDPNVFPDSGQKDQISISSAVEMCEKEATDIQSPPPSPSASHLSVNDDFDISPPSPDSDNENCSTNSYSQTRRICDQTNQQPPRFRPMSLIRRHCGRYSCGQCGKSFNSWNKLWLHQPLHRQTSRPFSCTQCELEFRFLGSYIDHLREHAAQRPYACPLCPHTYATEENLSTHISECHKSHEHMKCSTCGKKFSTPRNLKKHKLLHKRASSHFCLPCDLSFRNSSALRLHLKTHRTRLKAPQPKGPVEPLVFPYPCRTCTAKFSSADLLDAHQVCHFTLGKKPADSTMSSLLTEAPDMLRDILQAAQCKRVLPVSTKKHLFRYPHPDRLYVVPVMSSEPPIIISDTEEECQEIQIQALSSPSKAVSSKYPQGSSHHPPQDPLLLRSSDKSPVCRESHQNQETSRDIDIRRNDKNLEETSKVLMICKEKALVDDSHNCAVCMEKFTDISKLHEHYIDHARGM
ncbi:hypothetical protein LDENG_00289440 [Lucifuga dentata]|nr:hypothetical protein LDENG_00289440 [Lucifuga dentata]